MKKGPEISIVMTYFERLTQLRVTLDSIRSYNPASLEVVIVDDNSVIEPVPEDLPGQYPFEIRVIRPTGLKSVNPCMAFNLGFSKARGRKIIIQNAECAHAADLVGATRRDLTDSNYLSFGCYSLSKKRTLELWLDPPGVLKALPLQDRPVLFDGDEGWYNHSRHRPEAYHFASAITTANLRKLGGFDPRYASRAAWDDNEFVVRIRRLGLKIDIRDEEPVLHQWHYWLRELPAGTSERDNRALFEKVTLREEGFAPSRFSRPYLKYLVAERLGRLPTYDRPSTNAPGAIPSFVVEMSSLTAAWVSALFLVSTKVKTAKVLVLVPSDLLPALEDIQDRCGNLFIMDAALKDRLLANLPLICGPRAPVVINDPAALADEIRKAYG